MCWCHPHSLPQRLNVARQNVLFVQWNTRPLHAKIAFRVTPLSLLRALLNSPESKRIRCNGCSGVCAVFGMAEVLHLLNHAECGKLSTAKLKGQQHFNDNSNRQKVWEIASPLLNIPEVDCNPRTPIFTNTGSKVDRRRSPLKDIEDRAARLA